MDRELIRELLEEKKYAELKKLLPELNPADIAELIEEMGVHDTVLIFRLLNKDDAAEVFAFSDAEKRMEIVNASTEQEVEEIIGDLSFDDMIDTLEEMPATVVKKILANTPDEKRRMINQFLRYPLDSAGSLMTIEYVELKAHMTVKEALALIKETGISKETVYTCYVTDEGKRLTGFVTLRSIVTSNDDVTMRELMEEDVIFVRTHDDQEEVADVFLKYGFVVLPVVDNEHRLIGIITVDDIMDVIEQEATEDFQRMAAMAPSEEEYLDTPVLELAKHRITWLLILMISATFTGNIMNHYSDLLMSAIVLSRFVPMIMDAGGNAGSQSSTLIIRGLATGEVTLHDWGKVLWKELRIALSVGVVMGAVNFLKCYWIDGVGVHVGLLVSATLLCTITLAKLTGGMLPMLAKKVNIDPAIMAGPLITTLVDAFGLIIYFNLANLFIGL